jgi:hypothetical protein
MQLGWPTIPTGSELEKRFDAKWEEEPSSGCWIWTASITRTGYGMMRDGAKNKLAHRIAYELHRGHSVPEGLQLDHLCRKRNCINPYHLEAVTQSVNLLRSPELGKGTNGNEKKTHCPQGHPYDGDNLYVNPKGGRECVICRTERMAKFYQENKERWKRKD